jgi:N-acetylglucosamine-6-phosphate deacetylase
VRVAAGHTAASDADLDRAIAAGLTLCTHLGNAVPALLPRHDNIVQRLLARDELTACFIHTRS